MQKSVKTIGIVCFVLLLCMSFVLAACGTSPAGPEITKITLDKDTLSMQIGDEAILAATVEPVDQAANIVWTCDKDTVVKVENGKVTALSAGTAVVSAQNRAGTVYASCTIIVEEKANSVTLDKKALEMVVGEEQTLNATVDPASVANKLVWKCSPVGIVKVEGGKVTALSAGTATVTVSDPTGTKSDSCVVTVYAVATDITLDKTAVNMYVGDEQTIVATVTPQGTNSVAFNSNNTDVATVDDSGKIVAVGVGTANITVVLDGIEKTCVVTVYNKVTEITLNVQTLALYVGETHDLAVVTTPANNVKAPQFASANEEVATVDANGVITVVGAGTTTITATIDDVTASVTVSAVKVAFEQANYSLALNVEQQLALTFEPASAAVENVTYGSSAAGIVSVDAEGKVKAKAYGQAVITASVENKFSVTCTVTVSPLATEDGVSVEYGENGYAIRTEAGMHVNALNLGAQAASKIYYAEYTLNGMNLHDGQAKSFGMAHFATSESYMFDAFHMYLSGKDVTEAGFWHRMNVGGDLEKGLLLNQANVELGMVRDWIIDAIQNKKSLKVGIARNGNYIYTFINDVIVLQANIADVLKGADTAPAIFMNATDGESRTVGNIVFLEGEAAVNKINDAKRMLRYSRIVDNYMPATIAADNSSFRFDGADDSDAAWRASVTQEIVFGANTTIEMDVVVRNNADGHIAINIARNDGNGWTSKNNFTDGLTLVGYWMWTNGGKQQGVDYLSDNLTTWTNEWCGGPAEENKSGNFHIKIDLSRNEDGRVKSVLTISNGDTLMQTVEKTSVDVHDLNEQYRIHFLTHAIDYEVSNLTIVEKN